MGRTVEEVAPGRTHLLMGLEAVLSLEANFKNSALNSVREMGKVHSLNAMLGCKLEAFLSTNLGLPLRLPTR